MATRTIIVSNRLPVRAVRSPDNDGEVTLVRSSGGLVTGLEAVHRGGQTVWVGCLGDTGGAGEAQLRSLEHGGYAVVHLPADEYEAYYEGFSNSSVWPLFHYMVDRCSFTSANWRAYRSVNEAFARRIAEVAEPGDRVWVHDYQLMLVPQLLRSLRPDLSIGFFLHIPFPSAELYRVLPWRAELLRGLLGADLIGFHTLEYLRHFRNASARVLGLEPQIETIPYERRTVTLGAFPLGVDAERISRDARSPAAEDRLASYRRSFAGHTVFLGVDRLDYTKGVPERLRAFSDFLEENPDEVGRVSFVQVSVPSRVHVGQYRELKDEVDALVGRINGRFGSPGYAPIHYVFRNLDREELFALYRAADVCVVTPSRDGLNLVCKEYVAAKGGEAGVLVLSEFAGAAAEMGEAILVNPWDRDGLVAAMMKAAKLGETEQCSMMDGLLRRLLVSNNDTWSLNFLRALDTSAQRNHRDAPVSLADDERVSFLARVAAARRVFLFMDYDGTLVPVVERPEKAVPAVAVTELLGRLFRNEAIRVYVVSGRDRGFLERYLPSDVTLVAEHGACVRRPHTNDSEHLIDIGALAEPREQVLQVMRDLAGRVPGSLIEEKDFCVVWHYRMADPILGHQQALLLADSLGDLLSGSGLAVTIAKKAVEVRPLGVNKGDAVRKMLEEGAFDPAQDLLLTMGDDRTDEDMFRVRPEDNLSINIGEVRLQASYSMSQEELAGLLREVAATAGK